MRPRGFQDALTGVAVMAQVEPARNVAIDAAEDARIEPFLPCGIAEEAAIVYTVGPHFPALFRFPPLAGVGQLATALLAKLHWPGVMHSAGSIRHDSVMSIGVSLAAENGEEDG